MTQELAPAPGQVEGPEGSLHADDGGRGGLPVVFVHSFGGSAVHWQEQLQHLRQSRRAVAIDLRGHGQSAAPSSGGYAVPALAQDIAAVVDALQLDRFALVGHSMGGSAAIAYAGLHPEKVAGLVLVGTPGKSPAGQSKQIMGALDSDYGKTMKSYWESLLKGAQPAVRTVLEGDMQRVQRGASLAMIGAVFAYDPLPALAAYTGPRLIIDTPHGDGPSALYRQAPEVPHQVVSGTSHWPHLDKPREFDRLLDGFLAQLK